MKRILTALVALGLIAACSGGVSDTETQSDRISEEAEGPTTANPTTATPTTATTEPFDGPRHAEQVKATYEKYAYLYLKDYLYLDEEETVSLSEMCARSIGFHKVSPWQCFVDEFTALDPTRLTIKLDNDKLAPFKFDQKKLEELGYEAAGQVLSMTTLVFPELEEVVARDSWQTLAVVTLEDLAKLEQDQLGD